MIGKRVQVYFNLHKKIFSVRDKKTRLVIAHLNNICLEDVSLKVSEKGRLRVLKEKRKNIHAVVEGTICDDNGLYTSDFITYNPYKYDSFVYGGAKIPIYKCNNVVMKVADKVPSILEGTREK